MKITYFLAAITLFRVALFYSPVPTIDSSYADSLTAYESALEESIILTSKPLDSSKWEKVPDSHINHSTGNVATITSYSCSGLKTASEILMNCPNGVTASGTIPTPDYTAACERNLLGKSVFIAGVGERKCEDLGGGIGSNHIDLYVSDVSIAREWGVRKLSYTILDS